MKVLFMVPARSGSKGVINKNIRPLGGIPLIGHIIHAAQNTSVYRRGQASIIVSTDSEEYANIAIDLGAEAPFIRPPELSTDSSPITETIKYTYQKIRDSDQKFDIFVLLQATSPFTRSEDIDKAINMLEIQPETKSVISVTEVDTHPAWCNTLDESLSMKDFVSKELANKNRQELGLFYRLTGAIYAAKWKEFEMNGFDWFCDGSKALLVEKEYSLDIDSEIDFLFGEYLKFRG